MTRRANQPTNHSRGAALLLAMLFLAVFASLGVAMAHMAQGHLASSDTHRQATFANAAAETGVTFVRHRLDDLAVAITTDKGQIDPALAQQLWAQINQQLQADLASEAGHQADGWFLIDDDADGPRFQFTLQQHPINGEDYDSGFYQRSPYNFATHNRFTADEAAVAAANPITSRWVRLTVTGAYGQARRTIRLDLQIAKQVRYAILSRNRVMVGRNVIVKGPIATHYTDVDQRHGHPVQMRDNFRGLDPQLDGWLDQLATYLGGNDVDGDNRVKVADTRESGGLSDPASLDHNLDGYVDTYDMFLMKYDGDGDGAISAEEFSPGGAMVDHQLWEVMNEAKYPAGTAFDWDNQRVKLPGGTWTDASADLGAIDDSDVYAKVHGDVKFAVDESAWENGAAEGDYKQYFRGPIKPEAFHDPVTFGADSTQIADLGPSNFDVSGYRSLATGELASQVASPTPRDPELPSTYTPPSIETIESVPYGAPYPYDFYERPVIENMTFTNVTIPKGTNALFVNCKFIGVTFVDTESDNDDPNFSYAGVQESDGSQTYVNVSAEVDGANLADTKPVSNNLRFHDCRFEGVVVTENPSDFSHTRNKLQFTGKTSFDVDAPGMTVEQKQLYAKSTIMAPQYSIDLGTFTNPGASDELVTLEGTIVAGVLDVRGKAEINGAIVTTYQPQAGQGVLAEGGSPANFNTTIGYFESSAGDSEAELPDLGYGKIIIRFDPNRPLPDGIVGPISLRAEMDTWTEGGL